MAEAIATAVPFPVVGLPGVDRMWGPVCLDHPRASDAPTDVRRESGEAFARALACADSRHWFEIGARECVESYRMRSVPGGYPGDHVRRHERVINGRRYEFSRIAWGDGSVTVRAYFAGGGDPFREWTRCGVWTDPAYLGESAPEHTCGPGPVSGR